MRACELVEMRVSHGECVRLESPVCIIVMFLSDSHSYIRLPFTAEYPLLRHFYKPDEETNMSANFHFWVTVPLSKHLNPKESRSLVQSNS